MPPSGASGLNLLSNNAARALQFDNGMQLVQSANGVTNHGVSHAGLLNSALAAGPTAAQLRMVARIISVRSQLGVSRQVFFCSLGGFDTHSAQAGAHDALLGQVSGAVSAFLLALQGLLVDSQVTLFTASEFGRTLMPNSSGGTDHAWGGHHFVAGGAVIPQISVEQMGACLAKWFGVPEPSMGLIIPHMSRFPGSGLGFMA